VSAAADREARERELVRVAIVRLQTRVMAVTFAWVGGCGLFVATAWLLLRGGPNVGQHLSLLGNYFPGYSVSWPGALLGFLYGAVAGALFGWTIAAVYNRLVAWRNPGP